MGHNISATVGHELDPERACASQFENFTHEDGVKYCNTTYDGYLCWGPTPVGELAVQYCPPVRLSDTTKMAFRKCSDWGWLGRHPNESTIKGWTNYTPCFPPVVQSLFFNLNDEDDTKSQNKYTIAQWTRYLEIAGFSTSLLALSVSLYIFRNYRSLRNHRTRIHKSLFSAMLVQVVIRLILYTDQALVRMWYDETGTYDSSPVMGIENIPYLCEISYIFLEYTISCTFMWMLVEGIYLHSMVTSNALRENISYVTYYALGWGVPVIVTVIWAIMTSLYYQEQSVNRCWYGYNFSNLYWILQGPRLAVIVINMVFLLGIMRVLIVKLRHTNTTEMQKIKKAVRAALVLLPLLGITNSLNMIEAPLNGSVLEFALWSYSTHFLRSFQGFFIALIYCFLNGEVRLVLGKQYTDYMAVKEYRRKRQVTFQDLESNNQPRISEEENRNWIPLSNRRWTRSTTATTLNVSEIEFGQCTSHQKITTVKHAEPTEEPTAKAEAVAEDVKELAAGVKKTWPPRFTYRGTPRHEGVAVRNIELKENPIPE